MVEKSAGLWVCGWSCRQIWRSETPARQSLLIHGVVQGNLDAGAHDVGNLCISTAATMLMLKATYSLRLSIATDSNDAE